MSLTFEDLKIKTVCPPRRKGERMPCYNKTKFKLHYIYAPNIDNNVFCHLECLECGLQFCEQLKDETICNNQQNLPKPLQTQLV